MAADGAGIRFGQYVLLRRIARGGMAEVFLAEQHGLEGFDRRVAVKRILPHLADAPDFVKMFLGEAKLAARLSHPNIVHIYDFGKVEADYFIAMEYVDGVHAGQLSTLGETEVDRVPPTMVARLGADAAAALHYAHELRAPSGKAYGLVHRDVSPANLMVSFDGVVKLCDFGIAKAAALGDQLTNPGQVKGKYAYMSPEQTTGGPLDGRSDVFSLGIVMWELLTGKSIVPRGDVVEAMRAIRDGRLPPLPRVAPWTPDALAAAITWALQSRREHRPSAMQLAEQLEAFIKSSPELATPIQLGGWLRARFARDGRGEVASRAAETGAIPSVPPALGAGRPLGSPVSGPRIAARVPNPSVITSDTTSELIALALAHRAAPGAPGAPGAIEVVAEHPAPAAMAVPVSPAALAAAAMPAHRAQAPTVFPAMAPAHAPTRMGPHRAAEAATLIAADRSALGALAGPPPIAPPGSAAAPTLLDPHQRLLASMTRGSPLAGLPALTVIAPPPVPRSALGRRRVRLALAVGGLLGIAMLSFVIALAARESSSGTVEARDAMVIATATATAPRDAEVDATPPIGAAAIAATAVAAPPLDAAAPVIPPDAAGTTILEVRTRPDGAKVRVAGHRQVAPAQFVLPAGHYAIDAEADGWMPERRSVDLVEGERLIQDILFTTRLSHGPRRAQTGKLTVRTTPPCEVFLGTRRLTETPFTDMEFEPATYTLVFKHPRHQTVIRRVTITAGKTTRLSLTLP